MRLLILLDDEATLSEIFGWTVLNFGTLSFIDLKILFQEPISKATQEPYPTQGTIGSDRYP